ncbi:MAG TPA: hypothetical protein VIS72_01705, partial [Anaerolineales bacterium]
MTQPNSLNTEKVYKDQGDISGQPNPERDLLVSATWAAALLSFAAIAFFFYAVTSVNFHDWQDYVLVGFPVVLAGASLTSIYLMRRGQLTLGSSIIFGLNLLVPVLLAAFLTESFWPAFLYGFVSSALLVWRALPRPSWRWSIFTAVIVLLFVIVVSVINPPGRLNPTPTMNVFFAVVITLLFAAILAQAVRQAWGGNIRVKIVTAFTVVALTSLAILGTVTYTNFRKQVREDIRQRLLNMVNIIALQQDTDLLAAVQNPGDEDSDAFREIRAINTAIITTEPDLVYIYTMRRNEEGQLYFVVDTGQPGDEDTAAVAEVYEDASPKMVEAYKTNTTLVDEDFYTDEWGTFLSAYAPLHDVEGKIVGLVGIDIAADTVLAQERSVFLLILGTTLGTMVLVTILGLFLGNVFTKPIINLSNAAHRITEGDLSARAEVET